MSNTFRRINGVMMSGYEIHRYVILMAIFHKCLNPFLIRSSTNSRASYTESRIHFLYGIKGSMEQLKIFLHIRIFPEAAKIGLVPYFNGPLNNFLFSIAFHQMPQQ